MSPSLRLPQLPLSITCQCLFKCLNQCCLTTRLPARLPASRPAGSPPFLSLISLSEEIHQPLAPGGWQEHRLFTVDLFRRCGSFQQSQRFAPPSGGRSGCSRDLEQGARSKQAVWPTSQACSVELIAGGNHWQPLPVPIGRPRPAPSAAAARAGSSATLRRRRALKIATLCRQKVDLIFPPTVFFSASH